MSGRARRFCVTRKALLRPALVRPRAHTQLHNLWSRGKSVARASSDLFFSNANCVTRSQLNHFFAHSIEQACDRAHIVGARATLPDRLVCACACDGSTTHIRKRRQFALLTTCCRIGSRFNSIERRAAATTAASGVQIASRKSIICALLFRTCAARARKPAAFRFRSLGHANNATRGHLLAFSCVRACVCVARASLARSKSWFSHASGCAETMR